MYWRKFPRTARPDASPWTTLSVGFHGNLFTVSLDGQRLFDVEDSTFNGPGKTGLWTKADSVIYFDDFRIEPEGQKQRKE